MSTKPLSKLIDKSNDEVREAKEKLFLALHERNMVDYLVPLEQTLFNLLLTDPHVQRKCSALINKYY